MLSEKLIPSGLLHVYPVFEVEKSNSQTKKTTGRKIDTNRMKKTSKTNTIYTNLV